MPLWMTPQAGLRALLLTALLSLSWAPQLSAKTEPALKVTVLSIGDGDNTRGMEGGKPITVCLACNRCAAD
jgi:hypothetical protein